jgi:hypothetical protein
MNIIREFKDWATVSPKRRAITALIFMIPLCILFRLYTNPKFFWASPLKELAIFVGGSLLYAYVIYATETFRQQGKEIPHLSNTPGFSGLSLLIKFATALVILVSIGILLLFRIENWGGVPNLREQITMQLVGLAFLVPIGGFYLLCGWVFSNQKYLGWSYIIFLPAMALSIWNANFSWQNPVNPIPSGYEQLYSLAQIIPYLPISIMLIPIIIWLVMAWLKLRQSNKLAKIT